MGASVAVSQRVSLTASSGLGTAPWDIPGVGAGSAADRWVWANGDNVIWADSNNATWVPGNGVWANGDNFVWANGDNFEW